VGKAQKQPLHLTLGYCLPDHKALGSSPFQSTGHGSSSNVRSPCSGWTDRDGLEHAIRLGDIASDDLPRINQIFIRTEKGSDGPA